MTISIRIQPYLVDFMVSIYGPQPIEFPRKDNFNRILNEFLDKKQPAFSNYSATETNLEIRLPYFDDKNVLHNFHLSPAQQKALVSKIDNMFKLSFRDEMDQWMLMGIAKIDAIHLFMERYNIREDAIDMLQKDYQRFRDLKQKRGKKISSVKSRFCPEAP